MFAIQLIRYEKESKIKGEGIKHKNFLQVFVMDEIFFVRFCQQAKGGIKRIKNLP